MSEICKTLDASISKYIRPLTFPVAVKFVKEGEAIPEKAKVPTKALGYPIAICQAMTIARKYGWTLAMYKEDQACPLSHVILGYAEEPDFIKGGSVIKPLYVDNDEAAVKTQASTPKMPTADTHCIVLAPLHLATFDPDVVVCYGNSAQITRFVQGALYKVGGYCPRPGDPCRSQHDDRRQRGGHPQLDCQQDHRDGQGDQPTVRQSHTLQRRRNADDPPL